MEPDIEALEKKLAEMVTGSAAKDESEAENHEISNTIDISSVSHSSFPGAANLSPPQGRCVKEYEEHMANLKKENFNLKLKIYFLEEKHPERNPANGEENYFKENIDLKVELESVRADLQERQDLLCQAAKAIELMEQQQNEQYEKNEMVIDDLNSKIEALTIQVRDLQLAKCNKTLNGNETGFTEFLGAIDSKDSENQQKILDLEAQIKKQMEDQEELILDMKSLKSKNESYLVQIEDLKFENSEQKEKLSELEKHLGSLNVPQLQEQLVATKSKLADTLCQLSDAEKQLQEKTENCTKSIKAISKMAERIEDLELEVERLQMDHDGNHSPRSESDENYKQARQVIHNLRHQLETLANTKNEEIEKLKLELRKRTQNLQGLVNKELWEKNREIERLTQHINNMQNQQRQMRSLDAFSLNDVSLSNSVSFNEASFNSAMEKNKKAQEKINQLVKKLCESHDKVSKHDVDQLNAQLKTLNEEHENCEAIRKGCADLCAILSDRLEELGGFLGYLLKQSDVVALLGSEKGLAMQQAVNRSLDFSKSLNISRLSLPVDESLVHLENLTALGLLDGSYGSFRESTDNFTLVTNLRAEIEILKQQLEEKSRQTSPEASISEKKSSAPSESEEWSEPDRNVSMARMGLQQSTLVGEPSLESTSEENQLQQNKISDLQEELKEKEALLAEKNEVLIKVQEKLLQLESESQENLQKFNEDMMITFKEREAFRQAELQMEQEIETQKEEMEFMQKALVEKIGDLFALTKEKEKLNQEIKDWETQCDLLRQKSHELSDQLEGKDNMCKQLQEQLDVMEIHIQEKFVPKEDFEGLNLRTQRQQERMEKDQEQIIYMQTEITKMQGRLRENDQKILGLQEELDDSLEKLEELSEEKERILRELSELRKQIHEKDDELDTIKFEKTELALKLLRIDEENEGKQPEIPSSDIASGYGSEEVLSPKEEKENVLAVLEKPLLKTLEISDERKSLLLSNSLPADPNCESCVLLEKDVKNLKKEMNRLKSALAKACYKLSQQNQRKAEVENNIKKEILKTKDVLENVRSNMESQLKKDTKIGTKWN